MDLVSKKEECHFTLFFTVFSCSLLKKILFFLQNIFMVEFISFGAFIKKSLSVLVFSSINFNANNLMPSNISGVL